MMTQEEFGKLPKDQQDALIKTMLEAQNPKPVEKALPQLNMAEFKEIIQETAKEYIKGMTAVDKKHFAFPGIGKVDGDLTPAGKFHKTALFLKAIVGGDVNTCRTMSEEARVKANLSEGTTTAVGYLVPEEFSSEILRLVPTYGVIRQNCRIIPMKYDVMSIPNAVSDNNAYWVNEAAQIHSTDPVFGQVQLIIKKLGAIPRVTNELLADADVDIIQYLSMVIAETFAKEEDAQGFIGTGSPFYGVMNGTGMPTYQHTGAGTGILTLSYPDLVKMTTALYTGATANAKFYLHRTVIGHIRALITTAGAPIIGATANDIAGYPMIPTETLPGMSSASSTASAATYGIFGDLRRGLAMGVRGGIEMKISDVGTVGSDNLFEKDMVALRMIERVCFGVLIPSSYLVIRSN